MGFKGSNIFFGNEKNSVRNKGEDEETVLPEQFLEYKKHMADPRSQGNCGSCFAASTLTMLEARIRKFYPEIMKKYYKNPKDFAISLQHVLDCSVYNQGCDGGYSYLVSKYYQEMNMILKGCEGDNCQKQCQDPKLNELEAGITDFGYVGGAYGNCNEKKIMEEVYKNGPI